MLPVATPHDTVCPGCPDGCFTHAMSKGKFDLGLQFHYHNNGCYTSSWIIWDAGEKQGYLTTVAVVKDGSVVWGEGFGDDSLHNVRGLGHLVEECKKLMVLSKEQGRVNCICDLSFGNRHEEVRIKSLQFSSGGTTGCNFCGGTRGIKKPTYAEIVQRRK